MKKMVNGYISRLKGEEYQLDDRITSRYLIGIIIRRVIMKMRGRIRFLRRPSSPFIGRGVTIRGKSQIKFGYGLSIGDHSFIDALSQEGIKLGNNVAIGANTRIECTGNLRHLGKGLIVGDNVGLGSDNFFGCAGGIEIGMDTIIGNFVSFHAENHNFSDLQIPIRLQGVTHLGIFIGHNCWIGAKSTILDGARLEDGTIIAAGSVVTAGLYKSNGIYGGVPAKLIKYRTNE